MRRMAYRDAVKGSRRMMPAMHPMVTEDAAMDRRWTLMVATLVAVTLLVSMAVLTQGASPEPSSGAMAFTVVEHADTDTVIDAGATGDSIGDSLAFGNPVFDAQDATQVGRDEGVCFRTNPGVAWECTWTTILADGSLVVQGPFNDDGSDSILAVTGGTGAYDGASGQMTLHYRDAKGTQFDFSFDLLD